MWQMQCNAVGRREIFKRCPLPSRTFRRKSPLFKAKLHPYLGLSPKITGICFWRLSFTFKCTLPKQCSGRQWLTMWQMQCGKERYCPPSFRTWPQMLLHLWSSIQYKLLVTNTLQIDMINHRSALKHEEKFIWENPRHFVHICQLSYVSRGEKLYICSKMREKRLWCEMNDEEEKVFLSILSSVT